MQRVQRVHIAVLGLALTGLPAGGASNALADDDDADPEELEDVVQEAFLGQLATVQDERELQVTAAATWVETEAAHVVRPLLVGEWGITDRLQLEVETPFLISVPGQGDAAGGLGNAEVGLLYNLARSPELGLLVSCGVAGVLPTSSTDIIERAYGGGGLLSAYKVMGAVHANLSVEAGVEAATEAGDAELGVETALSILVPLGSIIPIIEVGFEREEESELQLAGGLAWQAGAGVEVGLAGLVSRGDEETEWGGLVALTWERGFGEAE